MQAELLQKICVLISEKQLVKFQAERVNREQTSLPGYLLQSCFSGLVWSLTSEHLWPCNVVVSGASLKTVTAQFVHLSLPPSNFASLNW